MSKTGAQLDAEIAAALAGRDLSKSMLGKLKTEIRRNLKAGWGPCRASRNALRTLDLDKIIGVQGDDDERGLDHVELHYADGHGNAPVLALNLVGSSWTVA